MFSHWLFWKDPAPRSAGRGEGAGASLFTIGGGQSEKILGFFWKISRGAIDIGGDSDKIERVEGKEAQATGVQGSWIWQGYSL